MVQSRHSEGREIEEVDEPMRKTGPVLGKNQY